MMNKAQTSGALLTLLMGLAAISAAAIFGVYFMRGGGDTYNVAFNESQFEEFDQSTQLINITQSTDQQLIGQNSSGSGTVVDVVTTGGYNSLKIMNTIPGIYAGTIGAAANIIGIPYDIANLAFIIVAGIIITVIIALIFKVYV